MKRNRATTKYKHLQQKSKLLVLGIISMLLLINTSSAQTLEVGAFGGGAYYLGDLSPNEFPHGHFDKNGLAYGGVLKYNFNQRLSVGLSATYTEITLDDPIINTIEIYELAISGEINFFPYSLSDGNNSWTPYIFGGVAYFEPVTDYTKSLRENISFPFGIGIRVNPINKIGVNLFWGPRKTLTDNLDDTDSLGYHDDWYVFYGLNITFAFRLKKDNSCRNIINSRYY